MSDFLDRLEQELLRAARRPARRRVPGFAASWSRRTVILVALGALALVAVPAVAAVTGAFKSHTPRHQHLLPPGPGLVDVNPPCVSHRQPALPPSSAPPPAELTALLAVLRRPQVPADRLPLSRVATLPVRGVNPNAIRLARTVHGVRYYLVPAQNVRWMPPPGNSPACKRITPPHIPPAAGVCLIELHSNGGGGGAGCSPTDAFRGGKTLMTSSGASHGRTHASGIVPDGVRAVIWRVRRGHGFLDTRIPVAGNVFAATVPGRHGHGLYVFYETATGRRLVIAPHRFTPRELALLRAEKARDRAAGPTPSVFPPVGGVKTIFTIRLRVARPGRDIVYVATIRAAACRKPSARQSIGIVPALSGTERGFLKASFGPDAQGGRWCKGPYNGTIEARPARHPVSGHGPVISRFNFQVR